MHLICAPGSSSTYMIDDTSVYSNNIITKESIIVLYYMTASLKRINKHLKSSSGLQLHKQITGRHMPRTPQDLQGTLDNYLVLSSIGFNKTSVSTLMVGTQQVE
jgi:hypothetical protein